MGLTEAGMQPFFRGQDCVACNGELYGFRPLKRQLEAEGCIFQSDSDCEILLPLYDRYGLDMFQHLDAEFAMILYDSRKKLLIAARDPIGIRPLFYGYSASGAIAFASEAKNLVGLVKKIYPFPIGSYYCNGQFVRYCDIADTPAYCQDDMDTILRNIREKLVAGVEKRLDADAPVGFLLSGGLDSSLVCAIAAKKLGKPIRTFAIGMDVDAIDLKYARQAADYLHADHTEVIISRDDVVAGVGAGGGRPGHLGHHHHPRVHRHVSGLPVYPRAHRRPGAAHRRDLRRTVRLQVHRLRPPAPRPSRPRARSASGNCICTTCCGPTAASASTAWKARVPFGDPGFRAVRHGHRPGEKAEHLRQGQVPAAQGRSRGTGCPTPSSGGRRRLSATRWAIPWWTT